LLGTVEARKTVQIGLIARWPTATSACWPTTNCCWLITRETLASREESLRLTRLTFDARRQFRPRLRQAESLLEAHVSRWRN
jgi:multidrug efflux system outer membrane protein